MISDAVEQVEAWESFRHHPGAPPQLLQMEVRKAFTRQQPTRRTLSFVSAPSSHEKGSSIELTTESGESRRGLE